MKKQSYGYVTLSQVPTMTRKSNSNHLIKVLKIN